MASTAAEREAARHWAANLRAISRTQPRLAATLPGVPAGIEWVYARDGSLTGRDERGWWSECSLPLRAAQATLRTLTVNGVVACFLAPAHGAQLRAALDLLDASQAVIALMPATRELRIALGCFDFSNDIEKHRLWFVWGENWDVELAELFDAHPGLPTPTDFIRTPLLPEDVAAHLIPAAERIVSATLTARIGQSASLAARNRAGTRRGKSSRLGVVAGSRFRLWNNAGPALAYVTANAAEGTHHRLDPDDPACASGLALALLASESDVLVTADLPRARLGALAPASVPVIAWITTPQVPAYVSECPGDALLLADPAWHAAARAAGWPESRLATAGWPAAWSLPANVPGAGIALIVDTLPLTTPKSDLTLSSHHLLWELIRDELTSDPFQLGGDVDQYLADRRDKMGIATDGFNRTLFIDRLLLPAYQQGLARSLIGAGLPLRVFGKTWDQLPDFRAAWGGPVRTAPELQAAVAGARLLVHPWPARFIHEIDTVGKPVLRCAGMRAETVIRAAREWMNATRSPSVEPRLSEEIVRRLIA